MEYNDWKKLSEEEKKKLSFKDLPSFNKRAIYFFVGVLVLVMVTCVSGGSGGSNDKDESSEIDTTVLHSTSTYFAEKAIKSILKAPSTAEFPSDDIRVWYLKDSSIVVKGTVDSQNSFGAMIRSNYYVKLKWWNDYNNAENWRILEYNLE